MDFRMFATVAAVLLPAVVVGAFLACTALCPSPVMAQTNETQVRRSRPAMPRPEQVRHRPGTAARPGTGEVRLAPAAVPARPIARPGTGEVRVVRPSGTVPGRPVVAPLPAPESEAGASLPAFPVVSQHRRGGTTPVTLARPGIFGPAAGPGRPVPGARPGPRGFPTVVPGPEAALPAPGAEVPFESLTVLETELPKDLIYSRAPKFPQNPATLREDRDLKRIAREAFDLEIYWRHVEAALVTLLTDGLNESISYYIIALRFKGEGATPEAHDEVEHIRRYMNRIVGRECVVLETPPYAVVIASDTPGEDSFKNVQALGETLEKKLSPLKPSDGAEDAGTTETKLPGVAPKVPAPGGPDGAAALRAREEAPAVSEDDDEE